MLISLSGFGNSGSSAVLDYLRGFEKINFFRDFEFQLLHETDGILDLKYHIVNSQDRIGCHSAISRFIRAQKKGTFSKRMRGLIGNKYDEWVNAYINEIILVSWKGESSVFDPDDVSSFSSIQIMNSFEHLINGGLRRINKKWHFPSYQMRYFSFLGEDEFNRITKRYLDELFSMLNINLYDETDTVVDMLFSATNISLGMELFDKPIAIIVVRDPRDLFFSSKFHYDHSRFMPNDNAEKFCIFYRAIMQNITKRANERTFVIQYEDLIYRYEETTKKICNILGRDVRPKNEFTYFDPTFSVRYTNLIKMYNKYPDEYDIIVNSLSEYLYDFSSSVSPKDDNELNNRIRKSSNKYIGIRDKN